MRYVVIMFIVVFAVPGLARAEGLPAQVGSEPIKINPSYNECFQMARDALKAEQVGVAMEAEVLEGADVADVPVETRETRQRKQRTLDIYPGLRGDKDFEQALLESGAEIIIDPENHGAAPRVELHGAKPEPAPVPAPNSDNTPGNTPDKTEPQPDADKADARPTPAEVFQQKKDVCRIKYGISF